MSEHPNWATLVEDPEQPWETLSSRLLVEGVRPVRQDRVRAGSGAEALYQYRPRGPRAVFVLPVTAAGEVVLIRQYRYPIRATITEIVAGGVELGEELLRAAQRELWEEVGGESDDWQALPGFYPQPSITGVVFFPFLALNVRLGDPHLEPTETIERFSVPVAEAYRLLERGDIQDGPSGLVLWQARRVLSERGLLP